jgi:ribosome-associated heat shock protein Hsp15
MEKVRIDKWLCAIRIFKSRTMATDAVKAGKVKSNGTTLKPSQSILVGDRIIVTKNGFNFEFEVLKLIDKRVGAPIAQTCYIDHTTAEELNKYNDWFAGKRGVESRDRGAGRPTKRERREIDDFKGNQVYDWDWDED